MGAGHRVEVDPDVRMLIPAELSAGFKDKVVKVVLDQGQIIVMTDEKFKKRLKVATK